MNPTSRETRHRSSGTLPPPTDLNLLMAELEEANATIARLNAHLESGERRVEGLRHTISYRLGAIITQAGTSLSGLLRLPVELARLRRDAVLLRRARGGTKSTAAASTETAAKLLGLLPLNREIVDPNTFDNLRARLEMDIAERGPRGALRELDRDDHLLPSIKAALFEFAASAFDPTDVDFALEARRLAAITEPTRKRLLALSKTQFRVGRLRDAEKTANEALAAEDIDDVRATPEIRLIQGWSRLAYLAESLGQRTAWTLTRARHCLFVVDRIAPHHSDKFTEAVSTFVDGVRNSSWRVEVMSRPGYPLDDETATNIPSECSDDGAPRLGRTPIDVYVTVAAELIAQHANACDATIIQGGGSIPVALAGLFAARKAGLPYVLFRPLGDRTLETHPSWIGSEAEYLLKSLEARLIAEADAFAEGNSSSVADVYDGLLGPKENH